MDIAEIIVIIGGIALVGFILWFFFGPRAATRATSVAADGVQQIEVVVKGGYSPDRIEVERGRPVRLIFRRDEASSCTEQLVMSDFGITKTLPQGERVSVEFTPQNTGEFVFHCGMNMVRGQLIVREQARD